MERRRWEMPCHYWELGNEISSYSTFCFYFMSKTIDDVVLGCEEDCGKKGLCTPSVMTTT